MLSEIGRHGSYTDAVRQVLSKLGDRATIVENAPHERVRLATAEAAIALVPSIYEEPFGRTAIEAMASRSALVFSRRGGLPEVVGPAGLSIEEVTTQCIAEATLTLAQDAGLRLSHASAARQRCVALFDIRQVTAHLDDIYDRILRSS